MNYAILDIETTGGSPKNDKITEIAVFIHDGEKIIDEFQTLINPERNIPYFITGITGITNEMVSGSPKFYEIAKEIVEITNNCVIVAHNAQFDYGFIQNEFKQLGYEFHKNTICTVKLSRKLIPGYKSYSLGKICQQLNISINGRHRAAGDALATVSLFEFLLETNRKNGNELSLEHKPRGRIKNLNSFLTPENIDQIPRETGVYYLHDSEGTLLYIGKSNNIHSRILGHLGNRETKRSNELRERIAGISFELTGSELIALLKESKEIKEHKPRFNRAQRRNTSVWGLYSFKDKSGYLNLKIDKTINHNEAAITCFNNMKEAKGILGKIVEKNWLCQKLCGLYQTNGACFHYDIRQCNGACIGKESVKEYNKRVNDMISQHLPDTDNILIIDCGRTSEERSVVSVESGVYKGFGYIDINESYLQIEDLKACISSCGDNRDTRQIIRSWLRKNKVEKIINY